MLTIIQSNKVDKLFDHLLNAYKNPSYQSSIFEPFQVIVPSKVMGEWLKKQVADKAGISTLVTTEFWGRYFLGLMQRVLRTYARISEDDDILDVPEVAMLSKNVMQWQIFGYLTQYRQAIVEQPQHPLYPFLSPLVEDKEADSPNTTGFAPDTPATIDSLSWANNQSLLSNDVISQSADLQTQDQRIWQLASDMANMLNRYMTYRPQWLSNWGQDKPVAVSDMIAKKDALHNRLNGRDASNAIETPDWLVEHYEQLEAAQRFLWRQLFDDDYRFREQLHQQFWQALNHSETRIRNISRSKLPKHVFLFTLQQLPPTELLDLQRLGVLTDVTILHFNPSEQFWADIVDKNWLMQMQMEDDASKHDAWYLKDYGHTLLSRFGKQSREVFAMLASLSGNEYEHVLWQDDFDNTPPNTLLEFIQHDILMLEEVATTAKINDMLKLVKGDEAKAAKAAKAANEDSRQNLAQQTQLLQQQLANIQSNGLKDIESTLGLYKAIKDKLKQESNKQLENVEKWRPKSLDTSIAIHVCHSMVRQLEVLRSMIIGWLNYSDMQATPAQIPTDPWDRRALSDILVLLPDIETHQNIIEATFPKHVGGDGYQLPAKVTGVVAKDINLLWQAITGYYTLLNRAGARFQRSEVFDWLMLAPLYESFGLNLEQMTRACDLLTQAGFIRGFDERHLQQTLSAADDDYRYTFAYALERLVAGVMMPKATVVSFGEYTNSFGVVEKFVPLTNLTMADADIVAVLCDIYQTLDDNRHLGNDVKTLPDWLSQIEKLIQQKFSLFNQTNAWRAIFAAQNDLKENIEANSKYLATVTSKTAKNSNPPTEPVQQIDTENLPLKLTFVLENIAQSIINQQVSAEPSGVITFARIGSVRSLPYKLVVMLNLNLSEFPKQEQQNRYNLMQAGLPIRGDRFREDDDLGAFLDALLCAKQACWIFYNGKSTTDTHEHLPASPVQELLDFLQNRMASDDAIVDPNNDSNSLSNNSQNPPNSQSANFEQWVKAYLVTHHAALPFDKSYFELPQAEQKNEQKSEHKDKGIQSPEQINDDRVSADLQQTTASLNQQIKLSKTALYPPAKIWHNLYTALQDKNATSTQPIVQVWDTKQLTDWLSQWQQLKQQLSDMPEQSQQHYVNLSKIVGNLADPAKAFVKAQNIAIPAQGDNDSGGNDRNDNDNEFESLTLDALDGWLLRKSLLDAFFAQALSDKGDNNHNIHKNEMKLAVNAQKPIIQESINIAINELLPAGVNRYQSLQQNQQQLKKDLQDFVHHLKTISKQLDATEAKLLGNFYSDKFGVLDVQNTDEVVQWVATALTPCEEQRIAISALALDKQAELMDSKESWVITANLPLYKPYQSIEDKVAAADNPSYWLNYLPTSGKEKYLLQFWLHHLCWQVLRRTTTQQAQMNDGFSLWQFSNKKTVYLPAIPCEQACGYLQDIVMVYQLIDSVVTIVPPAFCLSFLQKQQKQPEAPASQHLGDWLKDSNFNFVDVNQFDYPIWQHLIGDYKPSVIIGFAQTLGTLIYEPMLSMVKELHQLIEA